MPEDSMSSVLIPKIRDSGSIEGSYLMMETREIVLPTQ